jgi:hypothetical protein
MNKRNSNYFIFFMSAGGTLTQLVATGAQDTYLIGGDNQINTSCTSGCNIGNTYRSTQQAGQKMFVCNQATLQCEEQDIKQDMTNNNNIFFPSLDLCQRFCQ